MEEEREFIYMTIEVDTYSKCMRLYLDYDKNRAELNNKPFKMDARRFYNDLVPIISPWQCDMGGSNTRDGMAYYIKIEKDGRERVYRGRNSFPKNFRRFLGLLGEYGLW